MRCYDEWVPSDANISDLPSRLEYEQYFEILPNSIWVEPVLPNLSNWGSSFVQLQDLLRSRGTSLAQLRRMVLEHKRKYNY